MIEELIRQVDALRRRVEILETREASRRVYWPMHLADGGFPATAGSNILVAAQPSGMTLTPLKWTMRTYVATTNDPNNYWTLTLDYEDGTGMGSFDTQTDAPDVGVRHEVTSFVNSPMPATQKMLRIWAWKVGNAGNLYFANQLLVRLG